MLTTERRAALTAVKAGTVTARRANAPGSPVVFEPRELTVALNFLIRALLVDVETEYRSGGRGPLVTVRLTEVGEWIVSRLSA